MNLFFFSVSSALAFPARAALPRPVGLEWEPGRAHDVLIFKLAEGVDRSVGPALVPSAHPLFHRSPDALQADRERWDPEHRLADLSLWFRVRTPSAVELGTALLADPRVELASLDLAPTEPPFDIPPETPDFTGSQGYLGWPPDGLGFDDAATWPGGTASNAAIADVEYSWDEDHEDLESTAGALSWGIDSGYYRFHGTMVLGEMVAGDNGYGVLGMAPEARPIVVSPFGDDGQYNVAAAIDGAAALLDAGDVMLIEQQAEALGTYAPVEVSAAVFDAIALAVAKGIVVVEPAGNGALDLDDTELDGAFDRSVRDSGAILVGGGASPDSGYEPRSWYPWGSCYGSRVDLQGWYDGIATTANEEYGGYYADLFFPETDDFPDGDGRQAYTSQMGGTSGASPMIAAAAAVAQSVAWDLWGVPWDPADLRAALVSTGTPQAATDAEEIGPQPDMRTFLRTWAVR